MQLGTLAAIHRYPVKSLRGEDLNETPVDSNGLPGDRERALIVGEGHERAGKRYYGKANDRLHLTASLEDAVGLAEERHVPVSVERSDERFYDDSPVSLIVDRWLSGLSRHVGYDVEHERFRPNFYVRAVPRFHFTEEDLTGREIALGEVLMRVRYPIGRCVVTTYDLHGGDADPRILSYVARERENWMGIYCDVLRAGIVRLGDSFELVER